MPLWHWGPWSAAARAVAIPSSLENHGLMISRYKATCSEYKVPLRKLWCFFLSTIYSCLAGCAFPHFDCGYIIQNSYWRPLQLRSGVTPDVTMCNTMWNNGVRCMSLYILTAIKLHTYHASTIELHLVTFANVMRILGLPTFQSIFV